MTEPRDRRDDEIDAAFEQIVAGWDTEGGDLRQPELPARPLPSDPDPAPPAVDAGWRSYELAEPDDEFVPPTPAPLPAPRRDPWFWVTLVGLAGGGLLLIGLALFAPQSTGWWAWLGAAAFLVGFGVLVWRHGPAADAERDGWEDDSGARL